MPKLRVLVNSAQKEGVVMNSKHIFVFSCINTETITLAKSIKEEHSYQGCSLIFAIGDRNKTVSQSKHRDLTQGHYRVIYADVYGYLATSYSSRNNYTIILLSDSEQQNLTDALRLSETFGTKPNIKIICQSTSTAAECLIDNCNIANYKACDKPAQILRVHPERMEVYDHLYKQSLFDDACVVNDEKWINVVIIGFDRYCQEMLRGCLWCAQMDGYYLRVDLINTSPTIADAFLGMCPGIAERGSQPRMGEDYYDIHFHNTTGYGTQSFWQTLSALPSISRVIIGTGSDEQNMALAIQLRAFFSGQAIDHGKFSDHSSMTQQRPRIIATVRDDVQASMINNNGLSNFREQYYQIETIGNNSSVYSSSHILANELLEMAKLAHLQYGNEQDFWKYEYFRRSSMASAIHQKYREHLISDYTVAAIVEHRRWSAYMRSTEGYQYGVARDDLAKRHPSLTAYDNLSKVEQAKDFAMNQVQFSL